jgi:hypothetical protein
MRNSFFLLSFLFFTVFFLTVNCSEIIVSIVGDWSGSKRSSEKTGKKFQILETLDRAYRLWKLVRLINLSTFIENAWYFEEIKSQFDYEIHLSFYLHEFQVIVMIFPHRISSQHRSQSLIFHFLMMRMMIIVSRYLKITISFIDRWC